MRACVCVCVHVCGHNYMSHTHTYIYILIVTYIYVHAYVCTCISFSLNPKIKVWADASKRSSQHLKIIEGHSVGEGQKTRNRVHVLILVWSCSFPAREYSGKVGQFALVVIQQVQLCGCQLLLTFRPWSLAGLLQFQKGLDCRLHLFSRKLLDAGPSW